MNLIHFLTRAGVESRPLFYPIHTMPPYLGTGSFPIAEKISARGISLPSGAGLTWGQIDTVVALVQEFIGEDLFSFFKGVGSSKSLSSCPPIMNGPISSP